MPIMNSTGDELYDALCPGMNDTLSIAFTFLTQFDVEVVPGLDSFANREVAVRYYKLRKLDYVIYGRAVLDKEGASTLYLAVYDRDEEVVQTFSTIHLGFGSILFTNTGVKENCQVVIDDISMGDNIEELKVVPVGSHSVLIRQERMFGNHQLFHREIVVAEEVQSIIDFNNPLLTDKEQEHLDSEEAFIKENWYVPKNQDELSTTFGDLYLILKDESYAEDLIQKKAEYIVWQDIFEAGGEIPGITQA